MVTVKPRIHAHYSFYLRQWICENLLKIHLRWWEMLPPKRVNCSNRQLLRVRIRSWLSSTLLQNNMNKIWIKFHRFNKRLCACIFHWTVPLTFVLSFCDSVSLQALIDEDRLLSRLEVMGNQLQAYSKVRFVRLLNSPNSSQPSMINLTISPEPNGGRHPKGACSLNGGQTQLRNYSQRVPEAGSSGENRGG